MLNYLEETLKKLNIKLGYQVFEEIADEYLIFDIYSEKDIEFVDNVNLEITYFITLNYWHKSLSKISNYKIIKKHMKKAGFEFNDIKTLKKEKGLYGKNFTFTITEMEEE